GRRFGTVPRKTIGKVVLSRENWRFELLPRSRGALWLLWPALLCLVSVLAYVFHSFLFQQYLPGSNPEILARILAATAFYAVAWLLSRIAATALNRKANGKRKIPKL